MKTKILTPLLLLVLFLTISACSSQSTSTPEVAPTEQQAEARSGDPTEEPVATTLPEPRAEPSPGFEAVFEEAPCPMALPAGTVEGEHITCGYVDVPEEHANHSGDTVRLAVAVVHSASDKPAPDPLVMLAGGPGQSALEAYPPLLTLPGLNGFWAERDVVLVEQRGTKHSTPFLECQEVQAFQLETLDQDLNYEERKELHLEALTACRDRLVTEGVNLSAFDSLESAADIVAVLDALGYEEFNLYGGSYGSLLAQHIMRDYPDRVRSAILDAVSPLRHEPNVLYKAHSTDRALRLLFSQCQADPACDEIYPDLESVFLDTVDRLNGEPAAIQIQNPGTGETHPMLLSGDRLLTLTRDLLYRTEVLPNLPQILYDAADGDYTFFELLQAALLFQTGIADGLYKSVVCSELADFSVADMADSADLYPQVVAAVEPLIAEVMLDPCEVWNVEPLDESTKEPVTGDIPTLVLSGEFDPTVPPHLGEVAAEGLTNAYVYSFPGTGHSMIAAGECPVSVMQGFLNDPAQTADESCIDEMAGLVFRIPVEGLELEPFVDTQRGFRGLIPTGWQELQPANLARGSSALDVAYFVLEAQPVTADEMFANLAAQLELDPEMEPVSTAEVGSFAWDFYAFERQGYPADLALAEEDGKAYFVFMLSPADEHESLYDELFLPAVEAMAPISKTAEPADVEEPAGSQAQYGENFEIASCPFDLPPGQAEGETVECGYLTVPENRNDPDSREIRLAVAIFRPPEGTQPSDGSPRADPLIFLEGGPGGSALRIRVPSFDAFFAPMFAANRDIVVFDQRGTGFSEPALECPGYTELYLDLLDLEVEGQQLNAQEILERKVETFQACAEELSQVADLSAYNTAANAADVNELRLALGYDQVNLWGGSYGTRLALEVMREYPEGVRSAILDAPYPPEVDAYVDTPGSYARALSVLVERCASDEACNAAFPELRDTLFETVDRLNESPASLEVVHPLTGEHYARRLDGDGLLELVFRSLYDTALLPQLPQAIYDASEGTFTAFQRTMAIDILRQYIRNWGMYFSVLCHDEIPFSTWQEFKAAVAEHPEFAGFFGGFEVGGLSYQVCPGWGAGQAETRADEPVGNDIPAIVLTGEYDPIVPPNWGEQVAETLPSSYFFQFSSMGHGVLGADCPRSLVFAFLDDPTSRPDDACVAEMEITPFTVPLEAADVELEPYASEGKSIGGVAPAGWTEANPGVLVRGSTALDQTMLVLDVQPLDAETVLSLIVQQFGLDKAPQSQDEREANGLTWALYTAETQGYAIDSALAERGEATLVVLLVTAASERDVLHGAVFLPVVDALVPLD